MQSMIEATASQTEDMLQWFYEQYRDGKKVQIGDYEVDYTIMPTMSQFADGMFSKFPPEGEG